MDETRAVAAGHIPPIKGSRSEVMNIIRNFHRMEGLEREAVATMLASKSDPETAKLIAPLLGSLGGIPNMGIQSSHMLMLAVFFEAVKLGKIEFTEP